MELERNKSAAKTTSKNKKRTDNIKAVSKRQVESHRLRKIIRSRWWKIMRSITMVSFTFLCKVPPPSSIEYVVTFHPPSEKSVLHF